MWSTAQKSKAQNSFRVLLSSSDKTTDSTWQNPVFAVDISSQLSLFDSNRPLYCALESFVCRTAPTQSIYCVSWMNMPLLAQNFTTKSIPNGCMLISTGTGTNRTIAIESTGLGFLLNQAGLQQEKLWEFKLTQLDGTLMGNTEMTSGSYLMSLIFWQN